MRGAAPVSVRCCGGLRWRAVQALLCGLAAGTLAAWVLARQGGAAGWALPVVATAALPGWALAKAPWVELRWDGRQWSADGAAGRVVVMIELGSWLMLRFVPARRGPRRWVPLRGAEAAPALPALRAALYAQAAAGADSPDRLPTRPAR